MATQMITPKFQLGETVKLPSCSQKMTITWVYKLPDYGKTTNKYTGFMECSWFDGLQLQKEKFHQDALTKCDVFGEDIKTPEPILIKTISIKK